MDRGSEGSGQSRGQDEVWPSVNQGCLPESLVAAIGRVAGEGRITVLTGAGISAESGIPTFRGAEGYWTIGSHNYTPQEMATAAMFRHHPDAVWRWYLYRFGICQRAQPNAGHQAVAALERGLGSRFMLITQNIDGLHLRAGNSAGRVYQVHGSIAHMRCAAGCTSGLSPLPEALWSAQLPEQLSAVHREALTCRHCGGWMRPHVLWFDEYCDETWYRFDSALAAAARTDLLLVVGTSGTTNLPNLVAQVATDRGAVLVDVDPRPNPFADLADDRRAFYLQGGAGLWLPALAPLLGAGSAPIR